MPQLLSPETPILVTGGAGLIGSNIVYQLNRRGCRNVTIVDHLGLSEKWQNLRALDFVDYFEKEAFAALLKQDDTPQKYPLIFHLGACSDTTEPNASYLADNNYAFSKLLAQYACRHGSRLIYASSAATYGNGDQGFRDDTENIGILRPLNKYGFSKQLFDLHLLHQGLLLNDHNGATFVGLKYSNIYGPNEYHKGKMRSMFLRAYEQITADGKVRLFKSYRPEYQDGEQVRDFLYVKDAAAMSIFFAEAEGLSCRGLYNIGYGATRTWNDLAKAMFAALGLKPCIEYIDMPEDLRPRYQYLTCLDIGKIRRAGWTRQPLTMEQAALDYVQYLTTSAHVGEIDTDK
jgi:ADP-L-glycero-D-manno-heptose 6-epimerase